MNRPMENNWISVKDRLPQGEVLAIGYQNEMIVGYVAPDGEDGYMASSDDQDLYDVTHWMELPLPPPPKTNEP